MTREREIALKCRIDAGGFSGERVVSVIAADRKVRKVLAPRHYCWTEAGEPLQLDQPPPGQPLDGLVAARRIQELTNGQVAVTTPDGEVFAVLSETVAPRPSKSEIIHHVPV